MALTSSEGKAIGPGADSQPSPLYDLARGDQITSLLLNENPAECIPSGRGNGLESRGDDSHVGNADGRTVKGFASTNG